MVGVVPAPSSGSSIAWLRVERSGLRVVRERESEGEEEKQTSFCDAWMPAACLVKAWRGCRTACPISSTPPDLPHPSRHLN
jgi:hypothetical protein